MTRTLAMTTWLAAAVFLGGCSGVVNEVNTNWQASDSGQISQASYATGDSLSATTVTGDHDDASTSSQPYLLEPGDRVRVTVYGEPDLSTTYLVNAEGRITVPLIGGVDASGRSINRLSRSIANRLGATYIRAPQVTVNIDQYRPYYILGSIRKPGQYPYISGMIVEAAVATAGGYEDNANQDMMRLTRRIEGTAVVVEVPPQFPVLPGDSIYVNEGFVWPFIN